MITTIILARFWNDVLGDGPPAAREIAVVVIVSLVLCCLLFVYMFDDIVVFIVWGGRLWRARDGRPPTGGIELWIKYDCVSEEISMAVIFRPLQDQRQICIISERQAT